MQCPDCGTEMWQTGWGTSEAYTCPKCSCYIEIHHRQKAQAKSAEEEPYCICCGKLMSYIRAKLERKKFVDGKRFWKGHFQYQSHPKDIYDRNFVKHCEHCGHRLLDGDVHTVSEFMGMYGSARANQTILTGYKCSKCGFETEF